MKDPRAFLLPVLRRLAVFAAAILLADPPAIAATISLTGVSNGQVYTNPATIMMTASTTGAVGDNSYLHIYDGNTLLFFRAFNLASYSMNFKWVEPPLGNHALRAVVIDDNPASPSATINVSVAGSGLGFHALSNLTTIPSPPTTNDPTRLACQLIVSNVSSAASNPLRVRFFTSETYFYNTNLSPGATFNEYVQGPILSNGSLGTNASATFTLLISQNVTNPPSTGQFGQDGLQYHTFAVLEEQVGSQWAQVDRVKIFSSIPVIFFPYNDGVVGIEPLPNTNTFAYLTSLAIAGPTNILEGTTTNLLAIAGLSDGATGSVNAAWSASPISIGATGTLTAPLVNMDTPVTVTATFQRKTTRTTMRTVIIRDVVAPPGITAQPTNTFVPIGSNATFSVTATGGPPLAYQWRRNGTNMLNATNNFVVITNAQIFTNGSYTVVITNAALAVTSAPALLTVVARPAFTAPQMLANKTFQVTQSGTTGSVCKVEHSTNLTSWILFSNVTLLTSPITLMDPGASNLPRRFYRARVGP